MMIGSIQGTAPFGVSTLIRARAGESRLALPVERPDYLYARFEHLMGFPADRRGEGYSVEKLRALDNLIDRMKGLNDRLAGTVDISGLNGGQIDGLIRTYQQSLHAEISGLSMSGSAGAYYSGLVVNELV